MPCGVLSENHYYLLTVLPITHLLTLTVEKKSNAPVLIQSVLHYIYMCPCPLSSFHEDNLNNVMSREENRRR